MVEDVIGWTTEIREPTEEQLEAACLDFRLLSEYEKELLFCGLLGMIEGLRECLEAGRGIGS